jgi:hypothetical protein
LGQKNYWKVKLCGELPIGAERSGFNTLLCIVEKSVIFDIPKNGNFHGQLRVLVVSPLFVNSHHINLARGSASQRQPWILGIMGGPVACCLISLSFWQEVLTDHCLQVR